MNEPDNAGDIDQHIRINELREAAREAAGGEMTEWESPDCPPEIAEQFWANVLAYESAEQTCHFLQLEEAGIDLPPPEELDDAALSAKLWEVIHGLAKLNTFLSETDHLSDRELYEHLWHETLREITMDLPPDSGWTHHIDLLGSGSDEDNHLSRPAQTARRERPARPWRGASSGVRPGTISPLHQLLRPVEIAAAAGAGQLARRAPRQPRAARGNRRKFDRALNKVKKTRPHPHDRLDASPDP